LDVPSDSEDSGVAFSSASCIFVKFRENMEMAWSYRRIQKIPDLLSSTSGILMKLCDENMEMVNTWLGVVWASTLVCY
jgi:hypothetical protein